MTSPPPFAEIDVQAFQQKWLTADERLQLIDVREPQEVAIAALERFENLPLSDYAEWAETIAQRFDPSIETIVMCHHGMRSAQMCQWLAQQGFTHVKNLVGGIDAYACRIDPSIPRY